MKRWAFLGALVLTIPGVAQTPRVGVRHVVLGDANAMLTAWYPTADPGPSASRRAAYLREFIDGQEVTGESAESLAVARVRLLERTPLEGSELRRFLERQVPVVVDAAVPRRRLPVAVLSVGLDMPASALAELGESLAVQGIGLVAVAVGRQTGEVGRAGLGAGVDRATRALEAGLDWVVGQAWADSTRLWLGGWSVGGLAAARVARTSGRDLCGLLSLDSALGYEYAGETAVDAATRLPDALAVVHLWGPVPGSRRVPRSRLALERIPGMHVYLVTVPALSHAEFVSAYGRDLPTSRAPKERRRLAEGQRDLTQVVTWVVHARESSVPDTVALLPPRLGAAVIERLAPLGHSSATPPP